MTPVLKIWLLKGNSAEIITTETRNPPRKRGREIKNGGWREEWQRKSVKKDKKERERKRNCKKDLRKIK